MCMKEPEQLSLRINDLPYLTSPHQDSLVLWGSITKKSRSRWMTKMVKDESTTCLTGLNQSGPVSDKV